MAEEILISNTTHFVLKRSTVGNRKVVCVHGIGSNHENFDKLTIALLESEYTVLSYDLIGRGKSAFPSNGKFDGEAHITQLRQLIVDLDFNSSKYHLIAHSMGGAIITLYAEKYADEVQSLTLLAPAGLMNSIPHFFLRNCCSCFQNIIIQLIKHDQEKIWREDFVSHEGIRLQLENEWVAKLKSLFHDPNNPNHFEAVWRSVLQFPLYGLDESVAAVANAPKISVLLMWGKKDKAVPFADFDKWKFYFEEFRNNPLNIGSDNGKIIEYKVYNELAHGFFLEEYDEVNNSIVSFLNKCNI